MLVSKRRAWAEIVYSANLGVGTVGIPELEHQRWELVWDFEQGVFGKLVDLVCDILALHLVQVVLFPQSPLESPEDTERAALTLSR